MAEEIDDNKLIQAYRYWHDCGFDEGFEEGYGLGYDEGYEIGCKDGREGVSGEPVEKAEGLGVVQRNGVDQ